MRLDRHVIKSIDKYQIEVLYLSHEPGQPFRDMPRPEAFKALMVGADGDGKALNEMSPVVEAVLRLLASHVLERSIVVQWGKASWIQMRPGASG